MTEKRLRVAVLGLRGIPDVMGGIETHCNALYPRMAAKGHSVTIFARKGYVAKDGYFCCGVQVIPLWTPKKKNLEAIFHTTYGILWIAMRRNEFDLLHVHGVGPALVAPLARLCGLKLVMTHHGPDYDRQKWGAFAKFILRLGERMGCRSAGAVITVSRHIKSTIGKLYGCQGTYVPNGVPLPEILPPGPMMTKFDLDPRRYLLAVGRFVPEKGLHDLLNAFTRLDTDWQLVIAGASDHEDSYSRELRQLAAGDSRVVLTGFVKGRDLAEIYSNAGLFVLPSYHEGLPIALLEAMSYDLPVLASDIPANRELVTAAETFPAGDVETLAARIAAFVRAPVQAVVNRGRIEGEFNWDVVCDATERVYLDVTGFKSG